MARKAVGGGGTDEWLAPGHHTHSDDNNNALFHLMLFLGSIPQAKALLNETHLGDKVAEV